jgi:hypothetical protein
MFYSQESNQEIKFINPINKIYVRVCPIKYYFYKGTLYLPYGRIFFGHAYYLYKKYMHTISEAGTVSIFLLGQPNVFYAAAVLHD